VKAATLLLLVALVGAAPAAAQAADDPLLPPGRACPGALNVEAHYRTQRLAMHCLINLVRARAGVHRVRSSALLRHSATYKARRIAECKKFTHSPCGDRLARQFHEADVAHGQPWLVGETLGWRPVEEATAFEVLSGWLKSPRHRRVLVDPRFRRLGVRRRRLALDDLPHGIVLWVAHLGVPRRR
jgi:uncharacterized protein YkwD